MSAPASSLDLPPPAGRSQLVSVLAWIMLILAALSVLSSVMQALFFGTLATEMAPPGVGAEWQEAVASSARGMAIVAIVLSAAFGYAAFALLQRRNWARRVFVVLFALGIAGNVLWLLLFGAMFGAFQQLLGGDGTGLLGAMLIAAAFNIGMIVLLWWLIRRLRSPAVRSEFA